MKALFLNLSEILSAYSLIQMFHWVAWHGNLCLLLDVTILTSLHYGIHKESQNISEHYISFITVLNILSRFALHLIGNQILTEMHVASENDKGSHYQLLKLLIPIYITMVTNCEENKNFIIKQEPLKSKSQ